MACLLKTNGKEGKGGSGLNVITDFLKRKEAKKLRLERSMLVELSLVAIAKDARKSFFSYRERSLFVQRELEEMCIDVAIDAYLAGVAYSRFYVLGETEEDVRKRADTELNQFTEMLFDYWLFWGDYDAVLEELNHTCELFIERWWRVGLEKGTKRHRLRLH